MDRQSAGGGRAGRDPALVVVTSLGVAEGPVRFAAQLLGSWSDRAACHCRLCPGGSDVPAGTCPTRQPHRLRARRAVTAVDNLRSAGCVALEGALGQFCVRRCCDHRRGRRLWHAGRPGRAVGHRGRGVRPVSDHVDRVHGDLAVSGDDDQRPVRGSPRGVPPDLRRSPRAGDRSWARRASRSPRRFTPSGGCPRPARCC